MTLTVGSLFSGIGGLDLGLERAGMQVIWQVENDPYCQQVLEKHWPHTPRHGDIRKVDWHELEPPDVICGGFPCQPVSVAGRRKGQADERWLWPEFARAIRALRPRYVLVENVPGLLIRGMGDVLGTLAAIGYDTEWERIPAAAVGAPHLRHRIFIVAYPQGRVPDPGGSVLRQFGERGREQRGEQGPSVSRDDGAEEHVADTEVKSIGTGLRESEPARFGRRRPSDSSSTVADTMRDGRHKNGVGPDADRASRTRKIFEGEKPAPWWTPSASAGGCKDGDAGQHWAVKPDMGGSIDGVSAWLDGTWEAGLARTAEGVPNRTDRLRTLGNAVVPQVAELVGHRIVEAAT